MDRPTGGDDVGPDRRELRTAVFTAGKDADGAVSCEFELHIETQEGLDDFCGLVQNLLPGHAVTRGDVRVSG